MPWRLRKVLLLENEGWTWSIPPNPPRFFQTGMAHETYFPNVVKLYTIRDENLCLYTRISDWLWYFCPCDQSSRLDFRGFRTRNPARMGGTLWVRKKLRPFSSPSTAF